MGLRKRVGQKTYWHLLAARRRPSVYEIASSRLHWYPEHGFSVATPLREWYAKYQAGSLFSGVDWEAFRDPRSTTYASYTQLQNEREIHIDAVLGANDGEFDTAWWPCLASGLAPLRFPCHALMMLAAYLGSTAPGSRVTIAAAFQAGDEMRRVHALARRLHQWRQARPGMGDDARALWQAHAAWQPLRRLLEQTLVAYDWSECFIVLNLAVKPAFDELVNGACAAAARRADDRITAQLLDSFALDAQWHAAWARACLDTAMAQKPACKAGVRAVLERWIPQVDAALGALAPLFGESDDGAMAAHAVAARTRYLADCALDAKA